MESVNGLDYIFWDHFAPYRVDGNRNEFKISHAVVVGAIPLIGAACVAYFAGAFVAANTGAIVAVYAVMASVMTAIMPTINSLIGAVDRERIGSLKQGSVTSDANILEAKSLIAKVEIVRELYAAVAWSVIMLGISLLPLMVLSAAMFRSDALPTPVELTAVSRVTRAVFTFFIGFAGITSLVALLQIVSGVHLMLRHSQVDIESELKTLKDRYQI